MGLDEEFKNVEEKIDQVLYNEALSLLVSILENNPLIDKELVREAKTIKNKLILIENDIATERFPLPFLNRQRSSILRYAYNLMERAKRNEKTNRNLQKYAPSRLNNGEDKILKFPELDDASFESIIGIDNLKSIAWLQQGLQVAKSVCRIRAENKLGTGFKISPTLLITNNHVIPTETIANKSYADFNYQEDFPSLAARKISYQLSSEVFITSLKEKLDFTILKIIDDDHNPLSQWGELELDPYARPDENEHVCIIQHPEGKRKKICITANQVVKIKNHQILYTTDTMKGSSGAPVFDDDWHVIAIHQREGPTIIDKKRNSRETNQGILISKIFEFLDEKWPYE